MSDQRLKIRQLLQYEYQLGHNASEATRNICNAEGANFLNDSTARRWFQKFREGDFSIVYQPRTARPVCIDSNVLLICIEEDPTKSSRALAEEFNCSQKKCNKSSSFTRKTISKWKRNTPLLTVPQKQTRVRLCASLLKKNLTILIF